jgi:hypothetical protein
MAPTLAKPFHRPAWVYEERYDSWRMIAGWYIRRSK